MKPSKLEMLLSLFGSVFLMFSVFSEPLGLSEPLQWCALILAPVCFIPLIVLQRRRRNSRLAAGAWLQVDGQLPGRNDECRRCEDAFGAI